MSIFTLLDSNHILDEDDYIENAGMPEQFDLESSYNIAIYG